MPSRPVLVSLATSLLVAPVLSVMIAPPAQAAPAPAAKPKPAKVASPDYDGDGKADLAAVANGDDERYFVRVWYGSGRVADITYAELKPDSNIGNELLAADLDGDGYTDLIATSWGEKGTGIHVIPGSATGLQPSAQQTVMMSTNEATMVRSLALLESPVRRLAVGISTYRGSGKYADEVRLYRLSAAGRPTGTPIKLQPGSGKLPKLLKNSYFRPMESWGNQLFIGAPEAKVSGKAGAGAVAVVTLDSKGVKSVKVITQATKGVTGAVDKHDGFGWSLAARDGYLVVGTRADHVGAVKDTGSIQVFSLSKGKVKPVQRISQATAGVPGKAERYDLFGFSVAIGQSCNGVPVALVGGPGEGISHKQDDGSVWVIPLRKAKGCQARQLWEGHGLPGKPGYRGIGDVVGVVRDRGLVNDDLVIAGYGDFSEGPASRLFRVSAATGKTVVNHESFFRSVAGR